MKRVAQFAHVPMDSANCGTGISHSRPSTVNRITGTQIPWMVLCVGWRWLSPYSSSHCCIVRMVRLRRPAKQHGKSTVGAIGLERGRRHWAGLLRFQSGKAVNDGGDLRLVFAQFVEFYPR